MPAAEHHSNRTPRPKSPKQRELPLELENPAFSFPFNVLEFEREVGTLSSAGAGAWLRLCAWSWLNGPLPTTEHERATIARCGENFRVVWKEICSKFRRRRGRLVSPFIERRRARRLQLHDAAVAAGIASGAARRARSRPSTPATSTTPANVLRHRPKATFELLVAFATKSLFDQFDGGMWPPENPYALRTDDDVTAELRAGKRVLDLCPEPTLEDLKTLAGPFFDWRDDPGLVGRAFEASRAAWQRRHHTHWSQIERDERFERERRKAWRQKQR